MFSQYYHVQLDIDKFIFITSYMFIAIYYEEAQM